MQSTERAIIETFFADLYDECRIGETTVSKAAAHAVDDAAIGVSVGWYDATAWAHTEGEGTREFFVVESDGVFGGG